MAGIKILSPMVEEYIITVSIPMEAHIAITHWQNIGKAEKYFIEKRDIATEHEMKVEFDRARALLKWASCSNAALVEMRNADHKIKFYFSFSSAEDMFAFRDSMSINVSNATMR